MSQNHHLNTRILIIDDEESVRENINLILAGSNLGSGEKLKAAAVELFDEIEKDQIPVENYPNRFDFIVEEAADGKTGYEMVVKAIEQGDPYATVFCDMRMPGWDGIETIRHIRKIDERVNIIVITAYTEYDIGSINRVAGADVGYFVKPFSSEEVLQMATKAVLEWNKARELEELIRLLNSLTGNEGDMEKLLNHILENICQWLNSQSAAFFSTHTPDQTEELLEFRFGVGELAKPENVKPVIEKLHDFIDSLTSVHLAEDLIVVPLKQYGCVVCLMGNVTLTPDRIYLLKLFAEHAIMAFAKSEMHSRLLQAEKMSAIGSAVSFIVHDLKASIGGVLELLDLIKAENQQIFPREKMFEMIETSLEDAFTLAKDIIDYAKDHVNIKPNEMDIKSWLDDQITIWALRYPDQVNFKIEHEGDCPAYIDKSRFQRVLNNLIKNAIEAVKYAKNPTVKLSTRVEDNYLVMEILDNGIGIKEDLLPRLFQPFVTLNKAAGSGFGLAVVKQIVEAHQGAVNVESKSGETHFEIKIPSKPTEGN